MGAQMAGGGGGGGGGAESSSACDALHDAYLDDIMRTFVLPQLRRAGEGGGGRSLWHQVPPAKGSAGGVGRRASAELELQLFMRRDALCR